MVVTGEGGLSMVIPGKRRVIHCYHWERKDYSRFSLGREGLSSIMSMAFPFEFCCGQNTEIQNIKSKIVIYFQNRVEKQSLSSPSKTKSKFKIKKMKVEK